MQFFVAAYDIFSYILLYSSLLLKVVFDRLPMVYGVPNSWPFFAHPPLLQEGIGPGRTSCHVPSVQGPQTLGDMAQAHLEITLFLVFFHLVVVFQRHLLKEICVSKQAGKEMIHRVAAIQVNQGEDQVFILKLIVCSQSFASWTSLTPCTCLLPRRPLLPPRLASPSPPATGHNL